MQLNRNQKISALAVMAGIGLLLVLRLWTNGLAAHAHGPAALSVLASAEKAAQLWVFMDARFYQLSDKGEVLATYPLSSFDLMDGITDFQVISDSEILVGDPQARQTLRCNVKSKRCNALWPSNTVALTGLFKFHMDVMREVLFVADNGAHQLYVYPLGGKAARAVTLAGELRYPNDIWADQGQTLWVADTNHHRIVGLRPEGKLTKPLFKLKPEGETEKASHRWPIALAQDKEKQMWGLFADGLLIDAELLLFDAQHHAVKRIEFGAGVDAADIAVLGNHVIVADRDGVALHQVDTKTYAVSDFGTPELQLLIQSVRKKKHYYKWASVGCLIFMLLLLVPVFWLARQVTRVETAERQTYLARHGVRVN